MKATVTLVALLALSCAAFGTAVDPSLIIQTSTGSWNIPLGATSFSFDLSSSGTCSNTMAVVGGNTVPVSSSFNPTACVFRNAGPAWPGLNVFINLASSLPLGTVFSGSSSVFPNLVITPFVSGGVITGVLYAFSGPPGVPACPASTCEPDFVFGNWPGGTVTVNIVPEPASLALTGTGLLFVVPKVRKFLAKRMRIMS
jgi:hypothetical protein